MLLLWLINVAQAYCTLCNALRNVLLEAHGTLLAITTPKLQFISNSEENFAYQIVKE